MTLCRRCCSASEGGVGVTVLVAQEGAFPARRRNIFVALREEASRASSGSICGMERAVQSVVHQPQVLKFWFGDDWGQWIPDEYLVVLWIVEQAAAVLNSCEVSRDGSVAYRRLKGKDGGMKRIAFGEKVLLRRQPLSNGLNNLRGCLATASTWAYVRLAGRSSS